MRQRDADRQRNLKWWIGFGSTLSAFVLFLGLQITLYDMWVKMKDGGQIAGAAVRPSFSTPAMPAPSMGRSLAPKAPWKAAAAARHQVAAPVSDLAPFHRGIPLRDLAEQAEALALGRDGTRDPVRARLLALEALAESDVKGAIEPVLLPAVNALNLTFLNRRALTDATPGLPPSRQHRISGARIARDGQRALLTEADQSTRWASLGANPLPGRPVARAGQAILGHDDSLVAVVEGDDGIRVWAADAAQPVALLRGHEAAVNALAFSPDRRAAATTSWDETIRVWDIRSGRASLILRGHEGPALAAAFSADGRRVVTAGEDRTARIWNMRDGRMLAVLRGHLSEVHAAAFDATGRRVLTTSLDGTARLWDADTGAAVATLRLETGTVLSASFGPAGQRIAALSSNGDLLVWEADGSRLLATVTPPAGPVRSYALGANDMVLLMLGANGAAVLADSTTGQLRGLLSMPADDRLLAVAFGAGDRHVLAITASLELLTWPIHDTVEDLVAAARASAPRCLSVAERIELQIEAAVPRWCTDLGKPLGPAP